MSYDQNVTRYRQNSVLSTSREELVPLLYEHLLINLRRASKQIACKDIEGKALSVEKASAILYELLGSLDFEVGGELASRLASLYTYFLKELDEASRLLQSQRLGPIIEMVSSLHESWSEAAKIAASQGGGEGMRAMGAGA